MAILFASLHCSGQIYEPTGLEAQRNIQYDTLGVREVKEFGLGWKWKRKQLQSVKKYDSEGFLIELTFYEKKGRKKRKPAFTTTYSYNCNRTEVIETRTNRDKRKLDTSFISVHTFDSLGLLRSKIEFMIDLNQKRTITYSYDAHGNCSSIHRSEQYSNNTVQYQNDYDSVGRIVRQVEKNPMGNVSVYSRSYNEFGNVLLDSSGARVEAFKYNQNHQIERRDFYLDSAFYKRDEFRFKKCVIGSEHYQHDEKGRLISINYDCDTFVNVDVANSFLLLEQRFEYNERGLLITVENDFNVKMGRRPKKANARIFKYKTEKSKRND